MHNLYKINVSGACFCRLNRFIFMPPAISAVNCHCRVCQRISGSAFQTWLTVKKNHVLELPDRFTNVAQIKDGFKRYSCEVCGGHCYSSNERYPDLIGFSLASIDSGLDGITVQAHYCIEEHPVWNIVSDDLPRVPGKSDFDPLDD